MKILADPTDDLAKMELLRIGYNIEIPTIINLLEELECKNLYMLFQKLNDTCGLPIQDERFSKVLEVILFLQKLLHVNETNSPIGTVEWLFDNLKFDACNINEQDEQEIYEKEYGYLQQFLNSLRRKNYGTREEIYKDACVEAKKTIEIPLALQEKMNCVRVMNLHKAKGLEANIVILTYAKSRDSMIQNHIERKDSDSKNYQIISGVKEDKYNHTIDIKGIPPMWETDRDNNIVGKKDVELNFMKAEEVRLLYVAVTRAQTMLIINASPAWEVLTRYCNNKIETILNETSKKVIEDASSKEVVLDTEDITIKNLKELQEKVCISQSFAITPSKLDHSAPRKKSEDNENETIEQEPVLKNDNNASYGKSWGTIIHRVLELALRAKCYDEERLSGFAKQAISETVSDTLTSEQAGCLWKQKSRILTEQMVNELTSSIVKTLDFLQNKDSELLQLMGENQVFPEMSFFTTVEKDELYDYLCEHMKTTDVNGTDMSGKRLDVQGIIDLAILTSEGWIVVDYKTDRIKDGETIGDYSKRLTQEYSNQIGAYGKLLEMATDKPVLGMYLCSIPLGGKCISLINS